MIRTLRTEIRRALARRITRGLLVAAVIGSVVVGTIALVTSKSQDQLDASYQRDLEREVEFCVDDVYRWQQGSMVGRPTPDGNVQIVPADPGDPDAEMPSEEERRAQCEEETTLWWDRPTAFSLRDLWDPDNEQGLLLLPATLLLICGLGAGASMIGGEWKANTVTTLLVWEPNRSRLLGSRMIASFLVAAVAAVLLQLLFSAAWWPTAALKGSTSGLDSVWWTDYLQAVGRIGLMTGAAAVLGVALAGIARSTAGGVMAIFLWIAIGEQIVSTARPGLISWLIAPNLASLTVAENIDDGDFVITVADAALRLSVYVAVAVAVSLVLFQRRDVAG